LSAATEKAMIAVPDHAAVADLRVPVLPVGNPPQASVQGVVTALRSQRIDVTPGDEHWSGPTIVVFDTVSSGLLTLIRERSGGGSECLIALEVGPNVPDPGDLWAVLHAGASDVFAWDPALGAPAVVARLARWRQVEAMAKEASVSLIGTSPAWRRVVRRVVEIAGFTDSPLLITGESGTGKELVARIVHALDARSGKRDLVVLDCTTIVPSLSGSEFFGHERGAFTGADSSREGAFALADGGTLFLDEVGELPMALQAELLRVVQEGTYKRVGSNVWRNTSFRLVCATNRDLLQDAASNRFRRDFYYRIAAWRVDLPSLRERREDIIPLTRHFLRQIRASADDRGLDQPVVDLLIRREYPGNIRDLRHLVTRMAQRHVGPGPITLGDVPEEERCFGTSDDWLGGFESSVRAALAMGVGLKEITAAAADTAVRVAISSEDGSLQRASALLGVTPRALQQRRAAARANGGQTRPPSN
jgi:transcriptional regulator with GAF, ATPase, and Fis domain